MTSLEQRIEHYFEDREKFSPTDAPTDLIDALHDVFDGLDKGELRVAEKQKGDWIVNTWLKKAILLSFKCYPNQVIDGGMSRFYDKLPLKYSDTSAEEFAQQGVRVVPHAIARRGSFIGKNVILMPSYVNIGAYIDEGTLVDTWATVGSCAQIGKNVHISGGAGIGGILEPLQAQPTIIEDHCFIGARSEVVEGVIIEHHAVLSMGVFIGQSTKIYNRMTGEITYGRVPAGSVVVPGNLPSKDGSHSLYCAVIVKQVDEKTRAKVSINELLRDANA
jgi:2,3,4,5-tetrahydropyridine-2,6-dicarboxylate N-succinyltransferase